MNDLYTYFNKYGEVIQQDMVVQRLARAFQFL